jgi:hypothetical protein
VLVWITTDNGTADTGCTDRFLILLEHQVGCGLNKSDAGVIDQIWQLNHPLKSLLMFSISVILILLISDSYSGLWHSVRMFFH